MVQSRKSPRDLRVHGKSKKETENIISPRPPPSKATSHLEEKLSSTLLKAEKRQAHAYVKSQMDVCDEELEKVSQRMLLKANLDSPFHMEIHGEKTQGYTNKKMGKEEETRESMRTRRESLRSDRDGSSSYFISSDEGDDDEVESRRSRHPNDEREERHHGEKHHHVERERHHDEREGRHHYPSQKEDQSIETRSSKMHQLQEKQENLPSPSLWIQKIKQAQNWDGK